MTKNYEQKFCNKYPGLDDEDKFRVGLQKDLSFGGRYIQISDELLIGANIIPYGGMESNYYIDIFVYEPTDSKELEDDKRKEKHRIKFSVEWEKDNEIMIPSWYGVTPIVVNHERKWFEGIKVFQTCNLMRKTQDMVFGMVEQKEIKNDENIATTDFIINTLLDFLKNYKPLANDKNIQKGIELILPSLRKNIETVQEMWNNFDVDANIAYYQELLENAHNIPEIKTRDTEIDRITEIIHNLRLAKGYQPEKNYRNR